MRIPQQFPQYVGERALFVVTGSEDAKLFLATDGEITKVDAFRVRPPTFDATEKSLYPLKTTGKQVHLKAFITTLSVNIKKAVGKAKLDHAYLFIPAQLKNEIPSALPSTVTNVLRKTITGNYLDKSTNELLGILHK